MSKRQDKLKEQKAKPKKSTPKSGVTKPHEPNDVLREGVCNHVILGTPQDVIAEIMGIALGTLQKYYAHELKYGKAKKSGEVVGKLMTKINKECAASIMFYLKTQEGWKETQVQEHVLPQIELHEEDASGDAA